MRHIWRFWAILGGDISDQNPNWTLLLAPTISFDCQWKTCRKVALSNITKRVPLSKYYWATAGLQCEQQSKICIESKLTNKYSVENIAVWKAKKQSRTSVAGRTCTCSSQMEQPGIIICPTKPNQAEKCATSASVKTSQHIEHAEPKVFEDLTSLLGHSSFRPRVF